MAAWTSHSLWVPTHRSVQACRFLILAGARGTQPGVVTSRDGFEKEAGARFTELEADALFLSLFSTIWALLRRDNPESSELSQHFHPFFLPPTICTAFNQKRANYRIGEDTMKFRR